MTEDEDYDALSQKQLASIKRDMRISLEDAAVRATHKVMAEFEVLTRPEQQAEPVCPNCKAAVLYECVACSSNNYPPQQQAEPVQKLVAWGVFDGNLHDMFFTEEEAQEMVRLKGDGSTVAPLYTAPPQQQAEPVAWVCMNGEKHDIDFDQPEIDAIPVGTFLYTTPPQREWQGLTLEEILDLFDVNNVYGSKWIEFAITVEAALWSKNT